MKNRILSVIAISILLTNIFSGCSKKCGDFNSDVINWLPYKKADLIILTYNTNKDTLTLKSHVINHTDKVRYNAKCECADSYSVVISSNSIHINVDFLNSKSIKDSFIKINNDNLSFSEQLSFYYLNGKNYSNVLVYINKWQNQSTRFTKLYISKNIGIIEIVGQSEDWVIENDTNKSIDVSEIDFNETNC